MRASAGNGRPLALLLLLAAATLALDQFTKAAAVSHLTPGASQPLLGSWVRLTLTHNARSAFGLISSGPLLLAVGIAVCLALLAYVILGPGLRTHPGHALPLGLILGGSLGNLLDRIRTEGVIDFVDLRVWPVFNLADVAITAGFLLLALQILRRS